MALGQALLALGPERTTRAALAHLRVAVRSDNTLPLACWAAKRTGAKVILDAHEYAPRQAEHLLLWRMTFQGFYEYLCKKYLPSVGAMMTVCQGLADAYETNYGVRPVVVTNAQPSRVRFIG